MKKIIIILALTISANASEWLNIDLLISDGKYSKALENVNSKTDSGEEKSWRLGLINELMGKYPLAIKNYREALKKTNKEIYFEHLARSLFKQGYLKKSLKEVKKGRKRFPKSKSLFSINQIVANALNKKYQNNYKKMTASYSNQKYKETIAISNKNLSIYKNDLTSLMLKAYSLTEISNEKEALLTYKKIRKYHPKDLSHLSGLFHLYSKLQDEKSAFITILKLERVHKDTTDEHLELAHLYINTKNYHEAKKELIKAKKLSPKRIEVYEYYGLISLLEKNYASSIRSYRRAIALHNGNPQDYLNLDIAYSNDHKEAQALESLEDSLKWMPTNIALLNRAAYRAETTGNKEKASLYYNRALKVDPSSIESKNGLERVEFRGQSEILFDYKFSEIQSDYRNPYSSASNRYREKAARIRGGTFVSSKMWLGLEYVNTEYRKSANSIQNLDSHKVNSNLTWQNDDLLLYGRLGWEEIKSNQIAFGFSGIESKLNGAAFASYNIFDNKISLGYSKDTYVEDVAIALDVEHLQMISLQDQYFFNTNWSLTGQAANGNSETQEYWFYSLAPTYNLTSVKGLSFSLFAQYIDPKNESSYIDEAIRYKWDHSWNDKFETNLNGEFGYRENDNNSYTSVEVLLKVRIGKNYRTILGLESQLELDSLREDSFGSNLSFIANF